MFAVKEYDENYEFIGATYFFDNKEAIELAKNIKKHQSTYHVEVTEFDYNTQGELFELIL